MASLVMKARGLRPLSFSGDETTKTMGATEKHITHDIGRRMSYSLNKASKKKLEQPEQAIGRQSVMGKPATESQEISRAIKRGFYAAVPKKNWVHKMVNS